MRRGGRLRHNLRPAFRSLTLLLPGMVSKRPVPDGLDESLGVQCVRRFLATTVEGNM